MVPGTPNRYCSVGGSGVGPSSGAVGTAQTWNSVISTMAVPEFTWGLCAESGFALRAVEMQEDPCCRAGTSRQAMTQYWGSGGSSDVAVMTGVAYLGRGKIKK